MREPGCTLVFQIPPRVSAASGAGTEPSPRSANTSAAAESEVAEPACSSPATSHGALPAATSSSALPVRPRPTAPASSGHRGGQPRAGAEAAQRDQDKQRPRQPVLGPPATRRAEEPRQHGVPDEHRPGAHQQPLGDQRVPAVRRVTATSRTTSPAGSWSRSRSRAAPMPPAASARTSTSFCSSIPGTISSSTATTASDGTARGSPEPRPSDVRTAAPGRAPRPCRGPAGSRGPGPGPSTSSASASAQSTTGASRAPRAPHGDDPTTRRR